MNRPCIGLPPKKRCSPTLAINEIVRELWATGRNVSHLAFGESRMPLHPKLAQAIAENAFQKSYLDSAGLLQLRKAIAAFHERRGPIACDPEQIIVGPGSKAILFGILLSLDCHVLVPTPSWVSYTPQAQLIGRPFTRLAGSFDDGYEIRPASIVESLNEVDQARKPLLILNSPNNPTGQILSEPQLKELADVCRQNQIIVVSDEIYALTTYAGHRHRSIAEFYPEGTIVVGGPSKHLSLGGWRLGYAILPDSLTGQLIKAVLKNVASEIWSSPNSIIQHAAIQAYRSDVTLESYIRYCSELHEQKTLFLASAFQKLGIRCTEPQGAFYFIANFDKWKNQLANLGLSNSEQLSEYLLTNHDVATLPGSAFGIHENELSLRIATSFLDMETDESAQTLMSKFLTNGRRLEVADLPNTQMAIERMGHFVESVHSTQVEI